MKRPLTYEERIRNQIAAVANSYPDRVLHNALVIREAIKKLDHFTLAYIQCALWLLDEDAPSGDWLATGRYEEFLDKLSPEALAKMAVDCHRFHERCGHLFVMANVKRSRGHGSCTEMAGHDFWLTRNGHGAGFWDGDWSEPAATQLDEAAKSFGSCDLYIGDDGRIYAL